MTILEEALKSKKLDVRTTVWIILMHAGCLAAPFTFTWNAFYVFVALYFITGGLGICVGYHRLLTHRSFKCPKWVEYTLTILGCLTAQRSPVYWIARHRLHHAASDKDADPHSPQHGFLWSHMLWPMYDLRVKDENEYYKRYAPDLASDPGHRWIQKTHEIWPLLLAAGLFVVGGLPFLIWGLFVRTVVVYHVTWLVNSAGHRWGYQSHETGDFSQNNPWVALVSFGEGWHNNHHAFQASARHGRRWWEFDLSYRTICLMEYFGLASDIRRS